MRAAGIAFCLVVVLALATASTPSLVRPIPPPPVPSPATVAPGDDDPARYVVSKPAHASFPLFAGGRAAPVVVSGRDYPGVRRVVGDLSADIERVTGHRPAVTTDQVPRHDDVVLVGTLGHSPLVDRLVRAGKLDVRGIAGKWETSLEQVVVDPMPGVRRAFVIAGSDQRGTIYGAYDVSKQIGVSPWYWWDDVPVPRLPALYVLPGRHTQGTPAVKYRGIFLNDENPALGTWAPGFFGPGLAPGHPDGFNHQFYARVFETMLRLKANVLWPAAGTGPRLEYDMTLFTTGPVRVWAYLSPRNATLPGYGPRYAVSLDGEPPQVVDITTVTGADDAGTDPAWGRNVSDNVNRTVTTHTVTAPGRHVLKIWMIDPTVVVQKLVVDTGGLRPSYLGPPESRRAG